MAELLDHFKDNNADLRTPFIVSTEIFIIVTGLIMSVSWLMPVLLFSFESGFDPVSMFFLLLSLLFVAAPFVYAWSWRQRVRILGHGPSSDESRLLVISRIFAIFSIVFAWMGVLFFGVVIVLITPNALAGEMGLPNGDITILTLVASFLYVFLLTYYFRYTYKCYHQPKDSTKENS